MISGSSSRVRLRDRGERFEDAEAESSVSCGAVGTFCGGRLTPATLSALLAGRSPAAAAEACGGTDSSGDWGREGGTNGAGARGCGGRD